MAFNDDVNMKALLKKIKTSPIKGWQEVFTGKTRIDIDYYQAKASEGSIAAAEVLGSLCKFYLFMELLEGKKYIDKSEGLDIMNAVFECAANNLNDYQIFFAKLPQRILLMMKTYIDQLFEQYRGKKGEVEMKIRYCYVRFSCTPGPQVDTIQLNDRGIQLLKEGIKMYPDYPYYYDMLATVNTCMGDFKSALFIAKKGLEKFPNHVNLLYVKATNIDCLNSPETETERDRKNIVNAFQDFLNNAPADHPRAQKAYYHMACAYVKVLPSQGTKMMEHFYNLGKEAEKIMLPHLLPYDSVQEKAGIENLLMVFKTVEKLKHKNQKPKPISGVLHTKPYLNNPLRKNLVINQRRLIKEMKQLPEDQVASGSRKEVLQPELTHSFPKKMSQLKPITLKDMSFVTDQIYQERVIDLIIIEEIVFQFGWMQLIVQDENGDVTRLSIRTANLNIETRDEFRIGSKIAVVNPFMQNSGLDVDRGIRNDDLRCIMNLDVLQNMCRFCGEANAQQKCSLCKKAWYCSKECQQKDWKVMKHKLICSNI